MATAITRISRTLFSLVFPWVSLEQHTHRKETEKRHKIGEKGGAKILHFILANLTQDGQ